MTGDARKSKKSDDPFAFFNEIEWKTHETLSALDSFRRFWMETERLISEAADVSERMDHGFEPGTGNEAEDYYLKRQVARHLHDEIAAPTFRYGAVITLFAVIERQLKRFADNLAKEAQHPLGYRDLKGGLFDQIGRCTEAYSGFRISELPGYIEITQLQKVRNCLVHAYGEPSMMPSKDEKNLMKLNSEVAGLEMDGYPSLAVHPPFIENSLKATRMFFLALFNKVGWRINDRWKAKTQPPS